MSHPLPAQYRTCHAKVRYRTAQPVHIVMVVLWMDRQSEELHGRVSEHALCGVQAGEELDLKPPIATCRACKSRWRRAQGREHIEHPEARLIEANLDDWLAQGVLVYVMPAQLPDTWTVGYMNAQEDLLEITLRTFAEAQAFLAGMKAVGEWRLRARREADG